MKYETKTKLRAAIALLSSFILHPSSLKADLSAVVSPGYTFATGERPTTATLNRAANPTITITGTVGGTNANVANNSINGAMLVNGLPGSNLTWDASSPRKLVLTNDGVYANQLNPSVAGDGLLGGSGTNLAVNVDTSTIRITNDVVTLNLTTFSNLVLTLATNVAQYTFTNLSLSYVTPELTLAVGGLTNVAHNLGAKPTNLRGVLICKTNDNEYVVGDEIDLRTCWNNQPVFCFGANTTNVFISLAASGFQVADKLSGSTVAVTLARWRAKLYAAP